MSEEFCRGKNSDGSSCNCKEFSEPSDTNHSKPVRCTECLHGKSKHPKVKSVGTKSAVLEIFNKKVEKPNMGGMTGAGIPHPRKPTIGFDLARSKTLNGFNKRAVMAPALNKPKRSVGRQKLTEVTKEVSLGWLAVFVCGLADDGELQNQVPPSAVDIGKMVSRGCAKYDVTINSEWTHEECSAYFAEIFPNPFEYVQSITPTTTGKSRITRNTKSDWVLIAKVKRHLEVASVDKPSGEDLVRYKGGAKSGSENTHVYIALRCTVPEKVYKSWNTCIPLEISSANEDESLSSDDGDDENDSDYPGPSKQELTCNRTLDAKRKRLCEDVRDNVEPAQKKQKMLGAIPNRRMPLKPGCRQKLETVEQIQAGVPLFLLGSKSDDHQITDWKPASPLEAIRVASVSSSKSNASMRSTRTVSSTSERYKERRRVSEAPQRIVESDSYNHWAYGAETVDVHIYKNPWAADYCIRQVL